MAGKSPREAVANFLAPIKKSVACITPVFVTVSHRGRDAIDHPHTLLINGGDAFKLGGPAELTLELSQNYKIVTAEGDRGPFKVSTIGYWYTLRDHEDREVIGYHWHPNGHDIPWPHLHLKHGIGDQREEFEKAHVPTGRVAIEDVIRLLLLHFSVPPLKSDWATVLGESQEKFERWRTWAGSGQVRVGE